MVPFSIVFNISCNNNIAFVVARYVEHNGKRNHA